ncbi:hypothetical protein F4818DRAFT_410227 [Hypoxylon cercidicola]|nr:hypothetical protein F4818DRAFT_410227 [Hypoxylon cercidicola]
MTSTPTKPEANDAQPQLTQRETEVVAKAWLCIVQLKNGVPVIDSKKLAELGNYASGDSARHAWKPIERKLLAIAAAGPSISTPVKSKSTGRKRKMESADVEVLDTPTKRPRARKNTKAAVKKEKEEDDGDLAYGEA